MYRDKDRLDLDKAKAIYSIIGRRQKQPHNFFKSTI